MQSNDSAGAQAQCAAEAAASMAVSYQQQAVYQQQAQHFQETHGSNVSSDVCAGQKGDCGGGGPMRMPGAMLGEQA